MSDKPESPELSDDELGAATGGINPLVGMESSNEAMIGLAGKLATLDQSQHLGNLASSLADLKVGNVKAKRKKR